MPRKNLLSLHEAIVVALINQLSRTANFEDIATFIEERNLYPLRKGNIPLATQVMLRATKAKGAYHHLFEEVGAGYIRLRDSYANYPLMLYSGLEAILESHRQIYKTIPTKIRVKDEKLQAFRHVEFSVPNVICITTREKSGAKKFIYHKETDLQGNSTVGIYELNRSIEEMRNLFDPLYHFLVPVSDSCLVSVSFFELSTQKTLKPVLDVSELKELPPFKFSTSPAAKEYYRIFLKVQESYRHRISFEKAILDWKNENPT